MKSITLEPIARLEEDGVGAIVAFGAGADGLAYVVKATQPQEYRKQTKRSGGGPITQLSKPQTQVPL